MHHGVFLHMVLIGQKLKDGIGNKHHFYCLSFSQNSPSFFSTHHNLSTQKSFSCIKSQFASFPSPWWIPPKLRMLLQAIDRTTVTLTVQPHVTTKNHRHRHDSSSSVWVLVAVSVENLRLFILYPKLEANSKCLQRALEFTWGLKSRI